MKKSKNKILIGLIAAALVAPLAIAPVKAAPDAGAPFADAATQAAWIKRINGALQDMPPVSGKFHQNLPNGGQATGSYAIDWPNRLRFAYESGGETVVTVKGKFVAVQDAPGGEPNWFPVALTPLAVLRKAITDGIGATMVAGFTLRDNNYSIALKDPSGDLPGQAELFFTRHSDLLYAWRLTDVQNLVTLVRLSEIITHEALAPTYFEIIEYEEDDD